MRMTLLLLLALTWGHAQAASFIKGFVEVSPGHKLYVEHRPAAPGKTTLFAANGLTYSTANWFLLVRALDLLDPDIGIVLYDMEDMGKTLLKKAPVISDVTVQQQSEDLRNLKRKLAIQGPTALAGLSYGGAVTLESLAHGAEFDKYIAIAPFLERLPDQDQWVRNMVSNHRLTFPFDLRSDDELYDYYLRILVYTTYPSAEPSLLENPFKLEAAYRMVRSAKNWRALDLVGLFSAGKLHVIAGQNDPFVRLPWLQTFWAAIPIAARASFITILGVEHKSPEEAAPFLAKWILKILNNDPALEGGATFQGDPVTGEIHSSGSVNPSTYKVSACESLLRRMFGTN